MKPTAEQQLIIEAGLSTEQNLLVIARAGAAKTTTICLLADAFGQRDLEKAGWAFSEGKWRKGIREAPDFNSAFALSGLEPTVLCLAFNKKIAEELQTRLPASAKAQTLHSLGMKAWKQFIGSFPKVDAKKCYFLLRSAIESLEPADKDAAYSDMSEILKMISSAKAWGYLPEGVNKMAKPLMTDAECFASFDDQPTDLQWYLTRLVLKESFKAAIQGKIDFDDMVYLPAIMPCNFDYWPITMTDESQDFSILNHTLLRKIVKKNRLIAVGDPCQAIYAFRGAHDNSMDLMQDQFDMTSYFLTVCFRSSEAVVMNARWRAPDMQWGPTPPEGQVQRLNKWGPTTLRDSDAIICRNNAPLFKLALQLLQAGLNPELIAGDIVASLSKVMKKLGKPKISSDEALAALDDWYAKEEKTTRSFASLQDKMECIRIFLNKAPTLGDAIQLFEDLMARSGRIKLMTGHKSKGLEFHRVFFLDSFLVQKTGQDPNVKYVIETRAKNDLFYVDSAHFGSEDVEDAIAEEA